MINTVFNILKQLDVPLNWNNIPPFDEKNIVIDYHFFGERSAFFGDGKALDDYGNLQIDVYSKVDYSQIVSEIKYLLKEEGFIFEDGRDDIENLDEYTKLYHKVLIFSYSESEVKKLWEKQ